MLQLWRWCLRHDDQARPRRVEPELVPYTGDTQDDGPALGTAYDRAHALSVNQQGTQRPDRSAVGACRSRRREIGDKDLAQDPGCGVPVESPRLADMVFISLVGRLPDIILHTYLPVLAHVGCERVLR
jgi:hypothetical protein